MWQFLERGGVLMLPLVLASILVVAIIVERWLVLARVRTRVDDLLDDVAAFLRANDRDTAVSRCLQVRGPVGAALTALCRTWSLPPEQRDTLVSLAGNGALRTLATRLRALEVLSRVAPLVGLLGTVLGLVRAFMTLSTHRGAIEPSLLADGIWQALLTTVAGLLVAIPAILFHEWCVGRIEHVAFVMRESTARILALAPQDTVESSTPERETVP